VPRGAAVAPQAVLWIFRSSLLFERPGILFPMNNVNLKP
jgi:hypothetical protein